MSATSRSGPAPSGERQSSASTLSIIKAQIVFLLSTLTDDSYSKNEKEINALIDAHGADANIHLIRRLVQSAAPALSQPPNSPTPSPTPAPYLNLRLLSSCTAKLTSDPLLTHRFREAILAGFNDTSSGSASSEAFRQLGEDLPGFCDRAGLGGLQRLVLALEMVRVLIPPAQTGKTPPAQQTPSVRNAVALHAKSRDFGLAAISLLRDSWKAGLEEIAAGRAADVMGPVALSRLAERAMGDWALDAATNDLVVSTAEQDKPLLDTEQKRMFVRAIRGRLGQDLAMQVVLHALDSISFAETTSPINILHSLIPDAAFSTPKLLRTVLYARAGLPNPPVSPTSEEQCSALVLELIQLCSQQGPAVGIDPASFVRILVDFLPAESPLSSIIQHCFDAPPDDPRAILPPLPEIAGLNALAAMLSATPAAAQMLFLPWTSSARQLSLLERLLSVASDALTIGGLPDLAKVVYLEDVSNGSPAVRTLAQSVFHSPWNCLDLVQSVMRLAQVAQQATDPDSDEAAYAPLITDILDRGVKTAPELLLLGLMQVEDAPSQVRNHIVRRLAISFLAGQPGHQLVFHKLWQIDQEIVLTLFKEYYADSELNISRIVDIAQELHILPRVLDLRPWRLALDAAALASRREHLQLDRWLDSCIETHGAPFIKEIMNFVGSKTRYELKRNQTDPIPDAVSMPLISESIAIFLRSLRKHSDLFTNEDVEPFKEVRTLSLQLHPRLLNFAPGGDADLSMVVASYPPALEEEADQAFSNLYEERISVEALIDMLQKNRDSGDPRRVEFYQCMLHILMDELRFVSTYPESQLDLTAQLFGLIIQHQVVDHIPLGIAVRYVLDALKHPPHTPAFRFGLEALKRFYPCLREWPQLAAAIRSIPHLSTASPEIFKMLSEGGELNNPEDAPAGPSLQLSPAFTAIQAGEASTELIKPDMEVVDKFLFAINNLVPSNLESKVKDATDALSNQDNYRYLANRMVNARICVEPNNHNLYLDFLDKLAVAQLQKDILFETFAKSSSLLNADQTVTSSTDRTLLKNLGAWLGLITLARNKPIKHDNLSFKDLLIQGFDSGRLIVAIPFVCKILEQCAKSKVFKPPNPWLMAIVRLLIELYHTSDIKLNLKFEIEVLCRSLQIELKEVEPTELLHTRPQPSDHPDSGSAVHDGDVLGVYGKQGSFASQTAHSAAALQESITSAMQTLPDNLSFNAGIPYVSTNATFKRAVLLSIDQAIRDIIVPVVERSVTIAGITTKELTQKDFATEGDERKLRHNAKLMVQSLAGSLALVTCKEPLRISIIQHLKSSFLQNGIPESLPDHVVNLVASDNLEIACNIVERVAMERAISEIDDALASALALRRKHREQSNAPFWDASAMPAPQYTHLLPDPLRLKPKGLQPAQEQVYADFDRIRPAVSDVQMVEPPVNLPDARVAASYGMGGQPAGPAYTVQHAFDRFSSIFKELNVAVEQQSATSLTQLTEGDILTVMDQLPILPERSAEPNEAALMCSQKVVQVMYQSQTDLEREVYATLLQRLLNLSEKASKQVKNWLVFSEDERKYSVPVAITLLKQNIVPLPDLEGALCKSVARHRKASTIDFLSELVRQLLKENIISREQLIRSIETLASVTQAGNGTESSIRLLEELRLSTTAAPVTRSQQQQHEVREKLTRFFVIWVRYYQQSSSAELRFSEYVAMLQEHGVLKGEDLSTSFFRVCTEVCIENYIKQIAAGGTVEHGIYRPIDALGLLIALMLKYHGDGTENPGNAEAKAFYLYKVLTIVDLVLAQAHEDMGPHFAVAQKPFYRLFSSVFNNLSAFEANLEFAAPKIAATLCTLLLNIQPGFFPGFAYSWVALVSHRCLLPKVMRDPEGQTGYLRLLIKWLRFLCPLLSESPLTESTRALYMATCKLFMLLLHDYPDFLVMHHNALCDVLPTSCLQLQNIILSAFPFGSPPPDPFAVDTKESLSFIDAPLTAGDYGAQLSSIAPDMYLAIDSCLKDQGETDAVVANKGPLKTNIRGTSQYNRRVMTAMIMVLIGSDVKQDRLYDAGNASVRVLKAVLAELEPEGRYTLISSVASQLRYPNTHTQWASTCLLDLFEAADSDNFTSEVVLRVLLERVSCMKPHPWAVIYTLVELLRRHRPEDMDCLKRPELRTTLIPLLDRLRMKC